MPLLLPGILELSQRARYFSFHAYLLDRYLDLYGKGTVNKESQSAFIKAREWELGLAVLHCPYECGSVPVGAQALRSVLRHQRPPYPRGESVESPYGGYGLYYRSPMADLGIVARAGTLLGDSPIPVDVLYPHERARRLVETFRDAVADTVYVKTWMLRQNSIPVNVLEEYASVACLCQLVAHPDERDAVHNALFGDNPLDSEESDVDVSGAPSPESGDQDTEVALSAVAAVVQRRRSMAHYLSIVDQDPHVVDDEGAYREALWSPLVMRSPEHELVAGQWAALVAKDVWQECLCSIWSEFWKGEVSIPEGLGTSSVRFDRSVLKNC